MNEILWLDVDGFPYTLQSSRNILWIKDGTSRCYLRTPLPVASRGVDRISLYYLEEGHTTDSELYDE